MRLYEFPILVFLGPVCGAAIQESLLARHSKWTIGQIVHTSSGPVCGHAAANATEVSEYLGIPYAKPPIDDLRFAAPQKYESNKPINGTNFGYSCPIGINFGGGRPLNTTGKNLTAAGYAVIQSLFESSEVQKEDCLTINVWTKPQVGEHKKAVMVWIYGGGFTSGASADPLYDGKYIVDQEDVVLVSFNYRMNIFGFPGNPNAPQNIGFLDQRLAIEWTRDNIHSFGGDPSRITLFGQSAGAASIDLYSYAYTKEPIVSGLILESGSTGLGQYTPDEAAQSWYNVTTTLNCGDSTSDPNTLLTCMRTKSTAEILAAIPLGTSALGSAAFWPTIDNITVFSDYDTRNAAGDFIHVPMLLGNTDYEAGFHRTVSSLYDLYLPDSDWEAFDAASFTCAAGTRANASAATGLPTWRYRYFGEFADLRLTTYPDSRAWHGSEIMVLFDTFLDVETPGTPPPSREEVSVGSYLRGAWAAFAKDPENGLRFYDGWPEYDPGKETLIRLAVNDTAGISTVLPEVYDSACSEFAASE